MASSTSRTTVTGITGMSCSVQTKGWSLGVSAQSRRAPSGIEKPAPLAMTAASRPTKSLLSFGSLQPLPPSTMTSFVTASSWAGVIS